MSLLRVERLTVWYESLFGDVRALDRCSLAAEKGEITCLIGENGAGKSTLFKTVSGVVSEEDGRIAGGGIRFRGEEIAGRPPAAVVSLGLLHAPQGRHVFHTMSVRDNLVLGAFSRRRRKGHRARVREGMERIFSLFPVLRERAGQKAGTLSGGEQQMLSMGRALMCGPELLMLDEPFLGLAPRVVEEILKTLLALKREGLSLLVAEQDVRSALRVSDRGVVLERGYASASGSPGELAEVPAVRDLLLPGGTALPARAGRGPNDCRNP